MEIFLTLDYELFLFNPGNNVDQSLIDPTNKLISILNKHQIKAIFFVDVGYLLALSKQKDNYPKLASDYFKIVHQLKYLESQGHELGLHIHPHWEDCYFDGNRWKMDLSRYKLADFTKSDAELIFTKYYNVLQALSVKKIISYRAGGWCLEPFSHIKDAMRLHGIYIDASVVPGGYQHTATHSYDFRKYPSLPIWTFNIDPAIIEDQGCFYEIPCTAHKLPQLHYWKKIINVLFRPNHKDTLGEAVKPTFKEVLRKLFLKNIDAVSIDSNKSNSLLSSFKEKEHEQDAYYSIIGHPKCFDELTFSNLNIFLKYTMSRGHVFIVFSSHIKKPANF